MLPKRLFYYPSRFQVLPVVQGLENKIQVEMEVKDEKIRILQNKVDSMEEVYQNVLADSFGMDIFQHCL